MNQVERSQREQTEDRTKSYQHSLEDLVEERTADLLSAIEYLEREITDRTRMVEVLRRRNRELALLNRAAQTLGSSLDLDQVLVTVLEEVRRLLGAVAASVWLTALETNELVCRQAIGPQGEIVRGWRLAPGEGIAGWVVLNGHSLIVPDIRADLRHFKGVDEKTGLPLRSILAVPLRVKDVVIGVIQVVDTEANRFIAADLELLESLAPPAAIAIDNARLVETLRQRTAELEARNQELDAFAHTVAHDLKNPLTYAVGFAEALVDTYATMTDEELGRYLREIARSGRKVANIIDELMLLAGVRQMEMEMEPLDMASIVAEARQRLTPMIEEYRAEIILPAAWPVALGYGPWVEEVWVNYLSNAIKYGGRPPRVELGFSESTHQQISTDASLRPFVDSQIRFWVRDNGMGIPPEARVRLFTPFTRLNHVRARGQGHGLGLSIVRRIVEKLGGQVGVESQVGQGSVFSFTLPAALT